MTSKQTQTYSTMKPALRKWLLTIFTGGFISILFYSYLHFSETGIFPTLNNLTGFFLSAVIGSLLVSALYLINALLDQWLPWSKFFAGRFIAGYITNLFVAFIISLALSGFVIAIFNEDIFWKGLSLGDEDLVWKVAILFLSSLFIYNVVYALLYSYQHYTVAQIENLQRERKQLELQFEALKGQVSPHYLFNSLNTISSLLFKDLPSAEQFIRRLAQTYQYILSTQHKQYVLLKEEVEFVKSYYYLLRIRFQQQLDVEINLPSGVMNSKIPPLTLQMLVENAVKHNTLVADKKLLIYITSQDNTHLKVINTKTNEVGTVASFHVGLENIRKRYQFFTDAGIEVNDGEKFTVSLPVIPNKLQEQKFSA
jgi:two-component system LytT family sensor kinase